MTPVDPDDPAALEAVHLQELRRGTIVVASLLALRAPGYGYALLEHLAATGFDVDGNTLYPLLRRLEAQGLLSSEWDTGESRPRKFYRTSAQGAALAERLLTESHRLANALGQLADTPALAPSSEGDPS